MKELQAICRSAGLSPTGRKQELLDRLLDASFAKQALLRRRQGGSRATGVEHEGAAEQFDADPGVAGLQAAPSRAATGAERAVPPAAGSLPSPRGQKPLFVPMQRGSGPGATSNGGNRREPTRVPEVSFEQDAMEPVTYDNFETFHGDYGIAGCTLKEVRWVKGLTESGAKVMVGSVNKAHIPRTVP